MEGKTDRGVETGKEKGSVYNLLSEGDEEKVDAVYGSQPRNGALCAIILVSVCRRRRPLSGDLARELATFVPQVSALIVFRCPPLVVRQLLRVRGELFRSHLQSLWDAPPLIPLFFV